MQMCVHLSVCTVDVELRLRPPDASGNHKKKIKKKPQQRSLSVGRGSQSGARIFTARVEVGLLEHYLFVPLLARANTSTHTHTHAQTHTHTPLPRLSTRTKTHTHTL